MSRRKAVSVKYSMCTFCYASSNTHAPHYIFIWGLNLSAVSFLYFKKRSVLEKKWNRKCDSWIFTNFLWNISFFKKNWQNYYDKHNYAVCEIICTLVGFQNEFHFPPQICEKYSNIKFQKFRRMQSELLQSRRERRRSKYYIFVIRRSRLNLWLGFF